MTQEKATILVVEDDRQISTLLADFLEAKGFRTLVASDDVAMARMFVEQTIDLVVLDIMLPGKSGIDLCRDLRRASSVPVIMLTAKGDEGDRIIGLEAGADDYLAKPFNPRELLARIKAVLRRTKDGACALSASSRRSARFAGWRLDMLKRELTDPRGVIVDLSTGEYDLLIAFIEAPQRVLTRDYLLDASRARLSEAFDRSIDVQISRLRRKIETERDFIKTIRGVGYMFTPDVERTA